MNISLSNVKEGERFSWSRNNSDRNTQDKTSQYLKNIKSKNEVIIILSETNSIIRIFN